MLFCRALFFLVLISISQSGVASQVGIAAIVNQDVITTAELEARVQVALVSSTIPDTAESRARIVPQVLQILINEKLYFQKAAELDLSAKPQDLEMAERSIEQKNNLKRGEFASFVRSQGISLEAIRNQLSAQIVWQKLVNRLARSKVVVTDRDVNEFISRLTRAEDISEVQLSQLVISADESNRSQMLKTAKDIAVQVRSGGDFNKLAEQLTNAETVEIGWVSEDQLSDRVKAIVKKTPSGAVTDPIEVAGSYQIYKLHDRRSRKSASLGDNPDSVRKKLEQDKLEIESRALQRKLRESAFIEIRL